MMYDDEAEKLWNIMEEIYNMGVSDGLEKSNGVNIEIDLYSDSRCYNGYEPLEEFVNSIIKNHCKEAFKEGAEMAKKGYV